MPAPLRVLIIEDVEDDARLLLRELSRGDWQIHHRRVDSAADMTAALATEPWDIIISDYSMPNFSGLEALALARQKAADLPFILVSGTVGEETAVEALKAGAHDYLLKGNLKRLVSATERELREAKMRSERRRIEHELRKAHDELALANRAKDHFIAVLSHELRTPLTPVLAIVSQLETQADLPPELRGDLVTIRQNVEMEAHLIDDLLDLTRIVRNKLELHLQVIDAHALVRTVLETFQLDIDIKPLKLTLELNAPRHHVQADPARLRQVLANLLSNAVKFTPQTGAITITTQNIQDRLQIQIRDTGVGIDPQVLPRLFQMFEQGERTITRRFGGLGLGLSIAKSLVELHGGAITADSPGPGKGSTLTIEMPAVAPQTKIPPPPPPPTSKPTALRILLVEDHEDTRRTMARLLKIEGHTITQAVNVKEALELASKQTFDLLLSDIGLPDGTGNDIMRHFKAKTQTPGIAISGFGQEEDLQKSRDAGFQTHLTKPVDFRKLQDAISKITV
jgi:signal transduction histidine kinase